MIPVLPVSDWRTESANLRQPSDQYISPDGTTFVPAGQDFVNGALSWGVKSSDLIRAFGLAPRRPGQAFYLTDESDADHLVCHVAPDGSLTDFKLFANQGGESVAEDDQGNVYIAAGQIYVYDRAGKLIETIEVPERPLQLVFGGKDGKTLFIPARTSLYAVRTRIGGSQPVER